MSDRSDILLIEDMLESSEKILTYVNDLDYHDFFSNTLIQDAVVRNFEIIGEASNRISESFRYLNPQISWNELRGLRNRLIHEYFGVDYEILWFIITNELPELTFQLKLIVDENIE